MDKMYTKREMVEAISKVEELGKVNAELKELLYRGANDEKLVDRKRELQSAVRELKNLSSDESLILEKDEELKALRITFEFVVSKYKERQIRLETEINILKDES